MEENLPPGFRFHPTDEELITYYLSHKVSDVSFTSKAIVDVDLNKCEPWDLPGQMLRIGKLILFKISRPIMTEEWVVCRVFQKSAAVKKPQPTSSSQPSMGSPCDANSIVNEFGDVELPNLNINANPSSTGFSNIATPGYNNSTVNHGHLNMNLNVDFAAASVPSSLTWPSSILSPNLSMNSLLLKALQLRNYQPRDVTTMDYSLLSSASQGIPQFGTGLSPNFQAATASSSKVLDPTPQQQQQQQQQQEQPFNMDSMW
ncbi:hypothetical protein POUND7_006243 [Theobroma cacao]